MTPYELRYRDSAIQQPKNIPTNEFTEGILRRKSLRRFDKNKKLPPGLLEYLVCVAQASPTSSSGQSWSVIALETPEEKEEYRKTAGAVFDGTDPGNLLSFQECSVFLIWIADNFKISQGIDMVARRQAPESEPIFNSFKENVDMSWYYTSVDLTPKNDSCPPDKFLFYPHRHQEWLDQSYYSIRAVMDATIAAQTFSLAAESLGLGTVYIGSAAHSPVECYKNTLNLPDKTYPMFGMCVGYAPEEGTDQNGFIRQNKATMQWFRDNPDASIKPRQLPELVLHKTRYNQNVKRLLSRYNKIMIDYYSSLGRFNDYLVKKCIERIRKTVDQLDMMRQMGNRWR